MINSVTILGRLVKNPELRYTNGGIPYANATIANEQKYKEKTQVNYIEIVAFRGLAENLVKYCEQGRKVLVQGKLEIKKNNTGERVYTNTTVLAENIDFLEKPKEGSDLPIEAKDGYKQIEDDDVPF